MKKKKITKKKTLPKKKKVVKKIKKTKPVKKTKLVKKKGIKKINTKKKVDRLDKISKIDEDGTIHSVFENKGISLTKEEEKLLKGLYQKDLDLIEKELKDKMANKELIKTKVLDFPAEHFMNCFEAIRKSRNYQINTDKLKDYLWKMLQTKSQNLYDKYIEK